jgi:hypothetical protein
VHGAVTPSAAGDGWTKCPIGRFDLRSGGGQLGLGGLGRHEAGVRSAAAAYPDLVAGGGAFEVVAEVVAELVAADVDG